VEERYGVPPGKVTVTPNGVDPSFTPGGAGDGYLLFVGAIQRRKDPLAALEAARAVGLPLVVAGPEKEPALAQQLRAGGADLRGYVPKAELAELYRGAAALVLPSRFEGFGLPVLEAMACGTPVVAAPEPALREVAGDAAVYAEDGDFGAAVGRALAERARLSAAAIESPRPLGYAANLNLGCSRTTGDAVLAVNPDTRPAADAVPTLCAFMEAHARCGVAGPRLVYPDGRPQPSRRRFPTVTGTIVRRTPLRRLVPQRRHYHLDEPAPSEPVQSDWMLGGFLLLRRAMLDELGGFD